LLADSGRENTLRQPFQSRPLISFQALTENKSENTKTSFWTWFQKELFKPVDIASIVVFRILFGAIMIWEVWRYFENDWIRLYYIVRKFYFKYYGFAWVHPWQGDWMYVHFLAVALFAFCVMTGLYYRVTSWLLFFSFSFWYLLDATRYLNHLYMTALVAFILAVIPAHRARSYDVRMNPKLQSDTIPQWCLWLLQIQIGIVYFYAGLAKLNSDWLKGEPIRDWLSGRDDYPLIGPWFETEAATFFFGYGGLLFDLLVVPAILWKKTRTLGILAALFFNVSNKMMFNIGIFPVLMMGATLILLPPDWPRKWGLLFFPKPETNFNEKSPASSSLAYKRLVTTFFNAYVSFQLLFPFRHWLYPGNVHWTDEGHRFSWRMKLRDKTARVEFIATDPKTGKSWEIDQSEYLSTKQRKAFGKWTDMCIQFAHFMAEKLREKGYEDIEIRVRSEVSLNGRDYQPFIDPNVDLVKEKWTILPKPWILPLKEPLLEPGQ
jgi:vitamin K-dependent gamma-carboxylase